MVSSHYSLFRFLKFPTVYTWRSHRVLFHWFFFGCASLQVCNRIIGCFKQSAVNYGLPQSSIAAGPLHCSGYVAGILLQVLPVHFHIENSFLTGWLERVFFSFWFSSRHFIVSSQEELFTTFVVFFWCFFRVLAVACLNCARTRPTALEKAALQGICLWKLW